MLRALIAWHAACEALAANMRTFVAIVASSSLIACASAPTFPDTAAEDPDAINATPTGSIQVPSLCSRAGLDRRITLEGADAFAVAWTGDRYQLVYGDLGSKDLYSLQLDAEGTALGEAVPIEITPGVASSPVLFAKGIGFVVAWQDAGEEATVRVRRLDAGGQPAGEVTVVAKGRSPRMCPVLARSPDGVAIAWMDQLADASDDGLGDSMSYIAGLDEELRVLRSPQPIDADARTAYPSLAGSETSLAVLWSADHEGPADTWFGTFDDRLGLRGDHLLRDGGTSRPLLLEPLGADGYLAAWGDRRSGLEELYLSILDTDGLPHVTNLIEEPDTGAASSPRMARMGSAMVLVYGQFRGGRPQIFMSFIDANGARIGGAADAQISNTTEQARSPDVVWTGAGFGVFWVDARDGQPEIYFNRAMCRRPVPI